MTNRLFLTWTTLMCLFVLSVSAQAPETSVAVIPQSTITSTISALTQKHGADQQFRIERGVKQVAALWQESDGTADEFMAFCQTSFVADEAALDKLYTSVERNFEILNGYFNRMDVQMKMPLHLQGPEESPIDMMFGAYDVSAHLTDDLYGNKIAFVVSLNFPFYPLAEKERLGETWTRKQWAYARMGDKFTSRVPASVLQHIAEVSTQSEAYVSDYNIRMDGLRNAQGEQLFADGMTLITHWGLRDELKSNYADKVRGVEKQRMVYEVMKRIIEQSIPKEVINSTAYTWNPTTNTLYKDGKQIEGTPEATDRYEALLANFHAMRQLDAYSSSYPNAILRAFDGTMEISQHDVEQLFIGLLTSHQVKQVAAYIQRQVGRPLEPFDIWYNGFKAHGGIPEDSLTAITSKKYPTADALKADLPHILTKLGWTPEKANAIASLVAVDASRGAGHAWGAAMRNDFSRLRTRVGADGMDYKGYNIAVHEFGHNVEQTITMNDVDYYMLNGVPNTSFTEAVAFLFQKRDLELLGLKNSNPMDEHWLALDNFWSCYEIMGVSLVDIKVWEWMYAHPETTAEELKEAVMAISKEVWNKYYAGILGGKDEPLLGIYSHMINYPLYLPNYPMGHLINFQIEQQVRGKNLADELQRMYTTGSIIPQLWMRHAVNQPISIEPLLKATSVALQKIK